MGKKLAIKGHPTRGKEVIELLEMMGGDKIYNHWTGDREHMRYFINEQGNIDNTCMMTHHTNCEVFTLEEFLEKYPFKVGDKVTDCFGNSLTIKSMCWSENCETIMYEFAESHIVLTPKYLHAAIDNHTKPSKMKNVLAELLEHIKTTPKEELEKEFKEIEEWSNVGPTVDEFIDLCNKINKKLKYPMTYDECRTLLYLQDSIVEGHCGYEWRLINNLQKLLLCRDAYWKIAGEEMGLGKPWKPDWKKQDKKYIISVFEDTVIYFENDTSNSNTILAFPTAEMRDAFYENFKDLIEQCKELL